MFDPDILRGFLIVWGGVTLSVRMVYTRRARRRKADADAEKKPPHPLVIIAMGTWSAIIGLAVVMPEWVLAQTFSFPMMQAGQIVGAAGLICGLGILIRAHKALGDFYDIKLFVKDEHRVIDIGPYRTVRHPMYTTYFLWLASAGLLLPHYIFPILLIMAVTGFYRMAVTEEQMLSRALGDSYRDYMKRTGMFFPK